MLHAETTTPQPIQPPQLITAYEASRRLGVTMCHVYRMIAAGKLKTRRGVRDVRFIIWRPLEQEGR